MPLKQDCKEPLPDWLQALDLTGTNPLASIAFPLNEVLRRSLYYPACGFDGRPVKLLAGFVHSFIYVDYGTGSNALDVALTGGFRGYRLAGRKSLTIRDLAPQGWVPVVPPEFRDDVAHVRYQAGLIHPPFAEWIIFERDSGYGDEHGPKRFSLLYIGGDGVATYQALYITNNTAPQVLTIIQPGEAFGGNYTNFRDPNGLFAHVVLCMNGDRIPKYLVCGDMKMRPEAAFWPKTYGEYIEDWDRLGVWQR